MYNAATNTTLLIDDLYPWCRRLKRWLNAPESVTIRKMAPEACLCVCLQQIFGGFCLNFTLISFVLLYLDHSKTEWYCALSFECWMSFDMPKGNFSRTVWENMSHTTAARMHACVSVCIHCVRCIMILKMWKSRWLWDDLSHMLFSIPLARALAHCFSFALSILLSTVFPNIVSFTHSHGKWCPLILCMSVSVSVFVCGGSQTQAQIHVHDGNIIYNRSYPIANGSVRFTEPLWARLPSNESEISEQFCFQCGLARKSNQIVEKISIVYFRI